MLQLYSHSLGVCSTCLKTDDIGGERREIRPSAGYSMAEVHCKANNPNSRSGPIASFLDLLCATGIACSLTYLYQGLSSDELGESRRV